MMDNSPTFNIAIILPCYNEQTAIFNVVREFKAILPDATVYVYDNGSSDKTIEQAERAEAKVYSEPMRGKGHVIRRAFSDIDADIYIMADGDGTYEVARAPEMVELLVTKHLDMVVGVRTDNYGKPYRIGHRSGNVLFNKTISLLFGNKFSDILSGYRVFSRRFVKSFPALSEGFEIETELTIHAIQLRIPTAEVTTQYRQRETGSVSKLNTYRDGVKILWTIFLLTNHFKPFLLYSIIAALLACLSIFLGIPIFEEYFRTGLVPRFPTAILATGIMLLAALSFVCGLILHTISRGQLEVKRLYYLQSS